MKTWSNAKGDGKLFSIDMLDESGEIRGTFFNQQADKFFALIEAGKVYRIRGGALKPSNPKFNTLKNPFELSFSDATEVTLDDSSDAGVPTIKVCSLE